MKSTSRAPSNKRIDSVPIKWHTNVTSACVIFFFVIFFHIKERSMGTSMTMVGGASIVFTALPVPVFYNITPKDCLGN
jgi:hypothetical protein